MFKLTASLLGSFATSKCEARLSILSQMVAACLVFSHSGTVQTAIADRLANFGKQWVRSNPFTVMALNQGTSGLDLNEYQAAGLNSLLAWWSQTAAQTNIAGQAGVPWHAHVDQLENGLTSAVIAEINSIAAAPGGTGWLMHDEPDQSIFPEVAEVADYLRQNFPDQLIYTNSATPNGAYLNDLIATIQPDILMYDRYPFNEDGTTSTDRLFEDLMLVRNKARGANIPYFAFVQSYEGANRRLPSESDLRMHVYSHLTAGYKGIAYFAYHFTDIEHNVGLTSAMLDQNDQPTAAYAAAAGLGPEIENLGQSLRFLESTDVRFIPGQFESGGTFYDNYPPHNSGIGYWSAGAGGDTLITSVDLDLATAGLGREKNGLLGFFDDDAGQKYFMLSNLWHEADTASIDTQLTFHIDFDSSVSEVLMLNRLTGMQEVVPLAGNCLTVTLPGGTGNLYKFNTGNFAGVPIPIPGDFNGDDKVDGADLTDPNGWEARFGVDLDALDFLTWQRNFGTNVPLSASAVAVPEPSSLALSGLLLALILHSPALRYGASR